MPTVCDCSKGAITSMFPGSLFFLWGNTDSKGLSVLRNSVSACVVTLSSAEALIS